MKKLLALLMLLVVPLVSAQQSQTTNNLLSPNTWAGATTGVMSTNRLTGSSLLYDTNTGTLNWSYNQQTAAQTIAINNALSGSGVQVGGYNYTYDLRNMNGDNRQSSTDTMTVVTKMTSNTGAVLLTNTNIHNTRFDWTTFSGTQSLTTPVQLSGVGNLSISFTSKDSGFWAGYFGPEVRNVGMSLNYTVDPCVTNPAYSPNCANYNTVSVSNNLVPNPSGYAVYGNSIDQSYAINQALGLSGANVMIHGFQWGYTANANGPYCASWFILCLDNRTPSITTNVNITDANGNSLYSVTRNYSNSYNTTSYQYLFPSSRNLTTLGNFNFTASTNDVAYVGDMWSRALYTPDPCTMNPLSSTTCPGYAQAYHDQQCSANPLYAVDCAGYAAAYLTQQCSANPLYNASCPGYATAYFNQQCSVNPLYDSTCTGYVQAYFNQQCSASPLYDSRCPGYGQAYHDQQCSLNALYATDCSGYEQAYFTQQCTANPLYSSRCTGYAVAYKSQQCSLSALYATDCPGYQQAYLTQQCGINPLYSTSCSGYQQAYFTQQCNLNGLYDRTCPNYSTAYAKTQLLSQQSTTTTTAPLTTQTDPAVQTATSALSTGISDTTVSNAVASTSSNTTSQTSPTSVTGSNSVLAPSPATTAATQSAISSISVTPAPTQAQQQERQQDQKKTDGAVASVERKSGGDKKEVAKQVATAAKDAAEKSKNASTMEAQVASQGLVVGLMGYVPGFSAYQNAIVPDVLSNAVSRQYMKPNVDNRNAQRRLSGAQESRWQDMVDSQYTLGK